MAMKTSRLAQYCRRVGTSLHAGIEVRKIFDRETERAGAGERAAMHKVATSIASGQAMKDAFAAADGFFPPLVHGMVDVGEQSGKLDQAFLRLADHYDRQIELKRTFLAGIIWPMIQLVAALCIVGFVIWIVGALDLKDVNNKPVDLVGLGLSGTTGLAIYIAIVIGVGIAGLLCFRAVRAGLTWMAPVQRFVMAIPVLGNSLKTLALARLAWTLSVTLDTGMDTIRAVTMALKNSQNVIYTSGIETVSSVLRCGNTISEALRATGSYPAEFLDVMEVGEQTGETSESMARLSKLYEDRAKAVLAALTILAGFLIWGLVATFLIVLIFRFASFYIGQIQSLLP